MGGLPSPLGPFATDLLHEDVNISTEVSFDLLPTDTDVLLSACIVPDATGSETRGDGVLSDADLLALLEED